MPDSRMMKYGGNTTCVEISIGERTLILDAGTGIRKLGEDIMKRGTTEIDILITHSHWDHIQGFPFFVPLYSDKTVINLHGSASAYKQLKNILEGQMSFEYFPVSFKDLRSQIKFIQASGNEQEICGKKIKLMQMNHPIFTTGVRIEDNGKSFIFMTDNELAHEKPRASREEQVEFCRNGTYLIHDAQFTEHEYQNRKEWGHSTFEQAIDLAREAGVKNLGLFHHDPNRMDDELEKIEAKFKDLHKNNGLNIFAVRESTEIDL